MGNSNFKAWFLENLGEYAGDIAQHGAVSGFPHITYAKDCVALYDQFKDEIWEMLEEDAQSFGYPHPLAFLATFNQASMAMSDNSFKNLLLWHAVERIAYELEGVASELNEDLDEQPHIV